MFKRKHRVGRELFAEVMKGGVKTSTPLFLVRYKLNLSEPKLFKCSVVVSKKVAKKAVDRNSFRRRMYYAIGEIIKDNSNASAYTIIFFLKNNIKKVSFSDLKSEIGKVLKVIIS